jgi:hypothetical protein
MINLLPTIVLFFSLFLSIVLYTRIKIETKTNHTNEADDWYVTPFIIIVVCILWSYLFYLLH